MNFITELRDLIWGAPCIALLFGSGLIFTVKSNFFQFAGFGKILKKTLFSLGNQSKSGGISSLMALSTALGGTVGIGSIIGIAYSIALGGPGSIFWMWLSGFFGMMTKYAEVSAAVQYRVRDGDVYVGGACYALKAKRKTALAAFFAIACIIASLGSGSLTQCNAIAELLTMKNIPSYISGLVIAASLGFIVFKGQKFIAKISERVVPAVSVIYLLLITGIIILNFKSLPNVFLSIFQNAFGFDAAAGGITASIMISSFRQGFSKGVFSHEAGMGSSPIAHAAAENADPHTQGCWGIFEVFFDTFIVSTFTAIALLSSGFDDMGKLFEYFLGSFGGVLITILIIIFAFAAVMSWCFYAESCIRYLFKKPEIALFLYKAAFIFASFSGAVLPKGLAWDMADIFNALMVLPNTILLFICSKEIINILKIERVS